VSAWAVREKTKAEASRVKGKTVFLIGKGFFPLIWINLRTRMRPPGEVVKQIFFHRHRETRSPNSSLQRFLKLKGYRFDESVRSIEAWCVVLESGWWV
jgi:hypothetical protein